MLFFICFRASGDDIVARRSSNFRRVAAAVVETLSLRLGLAACVLFLAGGAAAGAFAGVFISLVMAILADWRLGRSSVTGGVAAVPPAAAAAIAVRVVFLVGGVAVAAAVGVVAVVLTTPNECRRVCRLAGATTDRLLLLLLLLLQLLLAGALTLRLLRRVRTGLGCCGLVLDLLLTLLLNPGPLATPCCLNRLSRLLCLVSLMPTPTIGVRLLRLESCLVLT